jgi:hypothetical protein
MSEHDKDKTEKPELQDLETNRDPKGGGGVKPVSGGGGSKPTPQPIPTPDQ